MLRDMNVVEGKDKVGEDGPVGSVQLLNLPVNFVLDPEMKGIIVSRVVRGGVAWGAGVRSGDFLLATSATLGDVSDFCDLFVLIVCVCVEIFCVYIYIYIYM